MRLLLLTNNLNSVNGITTFLYQQSKVLIQLNKYDIFIACSGGDAEEKFTNLGVTLINKPFFSFEKRNVKNFIKAVIYCLFIIIKYKIDVINPQIHYTAAFSFYANKILSKPFISTVHGVIETNYFKIALRSIFIW